MKKKRNRRVISHDLYYRLLELFEWHITESDDYGSQREFIRNNKRYLLTDCCGTSPVLKIELRPEYLKSYDDGEG